LTEALSRPVASVEWERIGVDFGFGREVLRGSLRFEDGSTDSVVAKRAMNEERADREERFYRQVGASFAPRFLGAAGGLLLLEDVGGRQGDVLAGCSVDEAMLVLEPLSRFHAAHRGGHKGFPGWGGDPRARQERHAAQADAFLERHGAQLPPTVVELVDALRTGLASVITELASAPSALIHGDLHLDNILFDAGNRPVVVVDWEVVSTGPVAFDVALFLYGSLSPDERRAVEDEVLAWYAAELACPIEEFRRHCVLALVVEFAGLIGWLLREPAADASPRVQAVREAVLGDGRLVAALVDLTEGFLG
jgi:phosphotransferase family enzyme